MLSAQRFHRKNTVTVSIIMVMMVHVSLVLYNTYIADLDVAPHYHNQNHTRKHSSTSIIYINIVWDS
ncbi:hypothetical protein GLYMA_14G203200v4 [Glycine max]|uniref:Uncharacterized protein n=1 Tax=Glycine max TaxID=3847 RepID=K7M870_SOYBN|nr:hypothetical protein GYH30_040652 [Glycine max]KRH17165.1 hypothetical protein GLYMA_14G203200v4 [Glycine max]